MQTLRRAIIEKRKEYPIGIVAPVDFVVGDGEPIEPEAVLKDPAFSLYCFDLENNLAIFVECPEAVDILQRVINGAPLEDADRKAIDDLLGSL